MYLKVIAQIFGRMASSSLRGSAQIFICSDKNYLNWKKMKNGREMVNILIGNEIKRINIGKFYFLSIY